MSITVSVQHTNEKIISIKCTSFRNKFVVVLSSSKVVAVFTPWWHEQM